MARQASERADEVQESAGRTAADVSVVLVEIGRALKGWAFYPDGHPARAELLDRAWRACQGDLRRHGPLDLTIRRGLFWLPGADAPISSARTDDIARQLYVRSVKRIVLDGTLDAQTLGAFLEVLAGDPDELAADGGFETVFYARPRHGIQVNEVDYRARLERERAAPAEPDALDDAGEPITGGDAHGPALLRTGDEQLSNLLGVLHAGLHAARVEAPEPEPPPDPRAVRRAELVEQLRDLDACDDDARYREIARSLCSTAQQLAEDGELDAVHEAIVRLAEHASDDAKRSFAQRESALQFLGHLATGEVLADLIERAAAPAAETSLPAAGALLQLGARAVPLLLGELEGEADAERRSRLAGVVIAMNEDACPALGEAIASGESRRQRVALRLAGETQNPRLVGSLREAFLGGSPDVARDAAQALVRIGDVSSLEVLAEALRSPRGAVAALAAWSLGATGRGIAVAPLVETLARALEHGDLALAREVVRGLGRLGRAEAVPALVGLLGRGGWFRRRQLREVQLAAISALAHLPGRDAEQALGRAARSRDARLREAAQAALERRAQESARP